MILTDNLKQGNIIIGLKSVNRWDVIAEMVDLIISNGLLAADYRDDVIRSLIEREKSMSTGIGNSVAIPHCITEKIREITIAIGISREGIDFKSIDNLGVRIVIMLLVPRDKPSQHIRMLASIAKMMNDEELRNRMLEFRNPEEMYKVLQNFVPRKN